MNLKTFFAILLSLGVFKTAWAQERMHKLTGEQGAVHLVVIFPVLSGIVMQPPGIGKVSGVGIAGIGTGAMYAYQRNKFVSFYCGILNGTALYGDRWADSTRYLNFQSASSFFISVQDHCIWKHFDFAYGVSVNRNHWTSEDHWERYTATQYLPDSVISATYTNYSLGGSFSLALQPKKKKFFTLGLVYRPQFMSLSGGTRLRYEYSLDFEILLRVPILRYPAGK